MKTSDRHHSGKIVRLIVGDLDREGDGRGATGVSGSPADPGREPAGLDVHVAGALPGEEISARVDAVSSHRAEAWATLLTIHRPSANRLAPACPAHGRCGGCVLQHCQIDAQVAWKTDWLRRLAAAEPSLAATPVRAMVTSSLNLGYRNNSKLVAARDDLGRVILGGYARRSHRVVDTAGCAITEPAVEAVAATLRQLINWHGVEPYDETQLTGTLRYAVLRGSAAGEVLVTLVTATETCPAGAPLAADLHARHPNVAGVVQNVNPSRGNAIYGVAQKTLIGAASIEDQINGVRLRVSSRAFFQANRQVAAAAYASIQHAVALTGTERVVDAYAGVGGIALTLAPNAHTVVGIEEHAGAVGDAQFSATLNNVSNATFVAGDVAEHLDTIHAADVVILNPPRKGCQSRVLRHVTMLQPRVIAYLSCAPETLMRDLAVLAALDYETRDLIPFDMLPHTPHVEVLAILGRRKH